MNGTMMFNYHRPSDLCCIQQKNQTIVQRPKSRNVKSWKWCNGQNALHIFLLYCVFGFLRNKYTTKVTVQTALLFLAMGNPFKFISMEVKRYAVRMDCGIVVLWLWAVMGGNLSLSLFFCKLCVLFRVTFWLLNCFVLFFLPFLLRFRVRFK